MVARANVLIGAHPRSEGLTLVTNNRREFERMPGLLVENWLSGPVRPCMVNAF